MSRGAGGTYRNPNAAAMDREAQWHRDFIASFMMVIEMRVGPIAEEQYAKASNFDPKILGNIMARETKITETKITDVEPTQTLGVLAG